MQISGIYGQNPKVEIPLTEDQKTSLKDILERYDADDMTGKDRRALRDELVEAGIPRNRESMQIMREAGFHDRSQTTGKNGQGLAQGLQKGQLWDIYQQFQNGDITEQEFMSRIGLQVAQGSLVDLMS